MAMKREQQFLDQEKTITIPDGWLEHWERELGERITSVMISYDQGSLIIQPISNPYGILVPFLKCGEKR